MLEYSVLQISAAEESGFKNAVFKQNILGQTDDLDEARRICMANQGGVICRNRDSSALPDTPGGHQPFGDLLEDLRNLKWTSTIEVLIPGTTKTALLGLFLCDL